MEQRQGAAGAGIDSAPLLRIRGAKILFRYRPAERWRWWWREPGMSSERGRGGCSFRVIRKLPAQVENGDHGAPLLHRAIVEKPDRPNRGVATPGADCRGRRCCCRVAAGTGVRACRVARLRSHAGAVRQPNRTHGRASSSSPTTTPTTSRCCCRVWRSCTLTPTCCSWWWTTRARTAPDGWCGSSPPPMRGCACWRGRNAVSGPPTCAASAAILSMAVS